VGNTALQCLLRGFFILLNNYYLPIIKIQLLYPSWYFRQRQLLLRC